MNFHVMRFKWINLTVSLILLVGLLALTFQRFGGFALSIDFAGGIKIEVKTSDKLNAESLRNFFDKYKCPITNLAGAFIEAADRHGLDWRLLPSIVFLETGGGKRENSAALGRKLINRSDFDGTLRLKWPETARRQYSCIGKGRFRISSASKCHLRRGKYRPYFPS